MDESEAIDAMQRLSNWGRWGADDVAGTLNLITPEKRIAAAALVVAGLAVPCSRKISKHDNRIFWPFSHFMLSSGDAAPAEGMGGATDWIGLGLHGSAVTHIDSPSHVFWNGRLYNGLSASLVSTISGATVGGIETCKDGIFTRGVLADIPAFRKVSQLEAGEAIYPDELVACLEAEGVLLHSGDVLIVRTGRDAANANHGQEGGYAGLQAACLPWLHERSPAVLVSDAANDVSPSGFQRMPFPIHVIGIVGMGLWLIDNAYLEDLAKTCAELGRWEFLFCVAPLRLEYTTGSPINPIAVF